MGKIAELVPLPMVTVVAAAAAKCEPSELAQYLLALSRLESATPGLKFAPLSLTAYFGELAKTINAKGDWNAEIEAGLKKCATEFKQGYVG